MLVIPRNCVLLAGLTGDQGRYSMSGVHVVECQDDWYRLEVTDGHKVAIVCGPSACTEAELGCIRAQLEPAANGGIEGIVPAVAWKRTFQQAGKHGHVGVVLGKTCAALATVDTLSGTPLLDGSFPDCNRVLPATLPLARFMVNPAYLAELLALATAIDPEGRRVEVFFYGPGRPIGLVAHNDQGQTMDALVMPLT